ncbi:glycosyl transferase family 2 [Shimia abyssi]|uniref:Glycosyl transferase family 2 n=1 Tax=Shimia abyssi TaxID=1662395 RepID=A0A2P8FBS2_9RHOB|nr:glycosyl transferase family 2 [Shimia abyssi]
MRVLSVTSVRNEGPYLLEWIAHHIGAGVTDFIVVSNDCDDGTHEILQALDRAGIVTHIPQVPLPNKSIQWQALRTAWRHPLRKTADWILVSDVDEFLNIHTGNHTITDLIAKVPNDTDAIALPWRLFGHNNVTMIQDAPVTEQFTRAIPPDTQFPIAASLFKTLFRAKGPFNQLGVHRPRQKDPTKAALPNFVDGSGNAMSGFLARTPHRLSLFDLGVARDLVELNHYAVRSAAGFVNKCDRGLPNRAHKPVDLAYWVERNFNNVIDTSIARMRPATTAALDRLMAIDGLADLHTQSVAWHRARFNHLISQPAYQTLMTQILVAGGGAVLPDHLQRQLVRWYQQANKPTG